MEANIFSAIRGHIGPWIKDKLWIISKEQSALKLFADICKEGPITLTCASKAHERPHKKIL